MGPQVPKDVTRDTARDLSGLVRAVLHTSLWEESSESEWQL